MHVAVDKLYVFVFLKLVFVVDDITYTTLTITPNEIHYELFPKAWGIPRNTSKAQPLFSHYEETYRDFVDYAFSDADVYKVAGITGVQSIVRVLSIEVYYYLRLNVDVRTNAKFLAAPPYNRIYG